MASEPVLASSCAAKCATQSHHQNHAKAKESNSMAGMAHCHEAVAEVMDDQKHDGQSAHTDHSKPAHQQHKACAMGMLCGFGQIATFSTVSKFVLLESSVLVFPKFTPAEKSADLSPPLKPPA